jgi:iron-sulfur cluster assembly accessory protein
MNIAMTAAAEKFIRRMTRFGGAEGSGFRLAVTTGGCSGLAADFSVEAAPKSGESVWEQNGVKLFLPAESRLLLDGVTIDFADTPTETGLVFRNPKSTGSSCSTQPAAAKPELVGLTSFGSKS